MTQEQKNQRLEEWAGWTGYCDQCSNGIVEHFDGEGNYAGSSSCEKCQGNPIPKPSYFTDLNAVHELEMKLGNSANPTSALWWQYITTLTKICGNVPAIFATAAQRAEALGITLGLWKEGE